MNTPFKVGDVVLDGLDNEHTVISLDGPSNYPLVTKCRGHIRMFTPLGKRFMEPGFHLHDLIPPKRTRTVMRWANIYPNSVGLYDDEKVARGFIGALERGDIIAVAVPVTFEVEY